MTESLVTINPTSNRIIIHRRYRLTPVCDSKCRGNERNGKMNEAKKITNEEKYHDSVVEIHNRNNACVKTRMRWNREKNEKCEWERASTRYCCETLCFPVEWVRRARNAFSTSGKTSLWIKSVCHPCFFSLSLFFICCKMCANIVVIVDDWRRQQQLRQ